MPDVVPLHPTGGSFSTQVVAVVLSGRRALLAAHESSPIRIVSVPGAILPSSTTCSAAWKERNVLDPSSFRVDDARRRRTLVPRPVVRCILRFSIRFVRVPSRPALFHLPARVRSFRSASIVVLDRSSRGDRTCAGRRSVPSLGRVLRDGRAGGDSYPGRFSYIRFSSHLSDLGKDELDAVDRRRKGR